MHLQRGESTIRDVRCDFTTTKEWQRKCVGELTCKKNSIEITTSTSTSTTTTTSAPASTTTITSTSASSSTARTANTSTPARHRTRSSSREILTHVVTTSFPNDAQTLRHNGTTDTVEKEERAKSICEKFPLICFLLISILIACGMPCGVFCVVGTLCANYDRCRERFRNRSIHIFDDAETHVANQALTAAQDAATAAKVKTAVAVRLAGTGKTPQNVIGLATSRSVGELTNILTTGDPRTFQGAHSAALDAGREELKRQRREARRNMRQNQGVPSASSNRAGSGNTSSDRRSTRRLQISDFVCGNDVDPGWGMSSTRRHQVAASLAVRDEALAQPSVIQESDQ